MRKLLLSIMLMTIAFNAKALTCDNDDKVRYQEMAKNISYSYTYNDNNNTFNIVLTNVNPALYFMNIDTDEGVEEIYNYTGSEMVINNRLPGSSYKYGIFRFR